MTTIITLAGFAFIVLAARQLGLLLSRLRFPLISGYLFAGIIAGPFVIQFISIDEIENLRFLEEVSLAFIAFAAGSELYLSELRSRLRSIAWHTVGQTIAIFLFGAVAMFLLADVIPFLRGMSLELRLAVALLTGAILVARSPSSAIAIVNELRARGTFTRTVLGVTIVMDVVVVVLFAVMTSIVDVILTAETFNVAFVFLLAFELALSVGIGLLVGKILQVILASRINQFAKIALILVVGFAIFDFSHLLREYTHTNWPFEVLLEPLLICMVGSFYVTNYTRYRPEFLEIVEEAGPVIYLVFFTLVGDALRLDVLAKTLIFTFIVFGIRLAGLFAGSLIGGAFAGDLPRHNRVAWMAYITQAGIGLGLARQAAVEFPQLGEEFTTLIVSAIVLSQIVGPPFLNYVIRWVGEARLHAQAEPDEIRDAVILGVGGQAQALARQLIAHDWQVILADTDPEHVAHNHANSEFDIRLLPEMSHDALSQMVTTSTDALVVMLGDDSANLKACELAYEHFGVPRMVARLNDYAMADRFRELGVQVVYPASAMVNLLDQSVRAPQTAALLMHEAAGNETVQITITNPDINNVRLRDLRLPGDVLVLGITRDGASILPHGHTVMKFNDEVTLVGSPRSLEEVTLRLGF